MKVFTTVSLHLDCSFLILLVTLSGLSLSYLSLSLFVFYSGKLSAVTSSNNASLLFSFWYTYTYIYVHIYIFIYIYILTSLLFTSISVSLYILWDLLLVPSSSSLIFSSALSSLLCIAYIGFFISYFSISSFPVGSFS